MYYLQTSDRAQALLDRLTKLAKIARKRAQANTLFGMIQIKVKKRYESGIVQSLMALMILAVRTTSHTSSNTD